MKILYELISTQHFVGGGAEYVRKVFFELLQKVNKNKRSNIFCLIDSRLTNWPYGDLTPDMLKSYGVQVVDISGSSFRRIIAQYEIDKVFVGVAQYLFQYDIENITCELLCVIHDLCGEERMLNHVNDFICLHHMNIFQYLRWRFYYFRHGNGLDVNSRVFSFLRTKSNVKIIAVSNYTKKSIIFNYDIDAEKIKVLYSPERISKLKDYVENEQLAQLISSNQKYFLMVSCNRHEKNAIKAIQAFEKFERLYEDYALVTIGWEGPLVSKQIVLSYLSESDLAYAISHSHALVFPSFFEGFGYPPIEAMKYGKPVLCSNVTSMPELLGQSAIWFSPFYTTDIFKAYLQLVSADYDKLCIESINTYHIIHNRQVSDLEKLIELILS